MTGHPAARRRGRARTEDTSPAANQLRWMLLGTGLVAVGVVVRRRAGRRTGHDHT
jgi:hypothetical protein